MAFQFNIKYLVRLWIHNFHFFMNLNLEFGRKQWRIFAKNPRKNSIGNRLLLSCLHVFVRFIDKMIIRDNQNIYQAVALRLPLFSHFINFLGWCKTDNINCISVGSLPSNEKMNCRTFSAHKNQTNKKTSAKKKK